MARRLRLPTDARVIGVGGALLGGSGRTPLALALTESLAARGAAVAFVGHGYGGSARAPLRVRREHGPSEVGDEAVLAFARLDPQGVPVWVGPREATLQAAARASALLVVDGLLQTTPIPVALSVLALSAPDPWGSARLWPRGDLRAPPAALVAAADEVVVLASHPVTSVEHAPNAQVVTTQLEVPATSPRMGLLLAFARPWRLERELARLGHRFVCTVRAADHGAAGLHRLAAHAVSKDELSSMWMTDKCGAGFGSTTLPIGLIRYRVTLPMALETRLQALAHSAHVVVPCLAETARARVSP